MYERDKVSIQTNGMETFTLVMVDEDSSTISFLSADFTRSSDEHRSRD